MTDKNENKLMIMLKSDNVKDRFIETVGRNGGDNGVEPERITAPMPYDFDGELEF